MRCLTYHRCSTNDQDPQLAREELRAAASRLGELVEEIEETGSGARNDRPGLRRVLELARTGKIDCVLVWKLDRWGRSSLDVRTNIRALESCGVRFIAISQGLDVRCRWPKLDPTADRPTSCPIGVADDGSSWTAPGAATAAVSAEIHRASTDRASEFPRDVTARS